MKVIVVGLLLAVAAAGSAFWWWSQQILPPNPASDEQVSFVVTKAQTGSEIIANLASQRLIRSPLAAKMFLYISDLQNKLLAGSFVVSRNLTLAQLFQTLTGPATDTWVTIPEGWRREQIAVRIDATLGQVPEGNFHWQDFISGTTGLEGQLFPDTYLLPRAASASDVIRIMTTNFATKTQLDPKADKDTLILASLVEREGKTEADRPVIAGILAKRLQAGWPLQVDATVQYAQDNDRCKTSGVNTCKYWEPVTDSKFSSLYNTYLHPGLPPAPIANPGLASIQAAQNPADTPYWFYIHDNQGLVHYAQTAAEHAANVDKYLR